MVTVDGRGSCSPTLRTWATPITGWGVAVPVAAGVALANSHNGESDDETGDHRAGPAHHRVSTAPLGTGAGVPRVGIYSHSPSIHRTHSRVHRW
jgi:hypothetical protein